jgi:hypothetical protein
MYQDYKIIVCTPVGRKKNLEILIPYILSEPLIDRYDLWMNTDNLEDKEYIESLNKFDKINIIYPEYKYKGPWIGCRISEFYKYCNDKNAIYIKIDDDICWIENSLFEKLIKFRINKPEYWIIHPLTINNSTSNFILEVLNKFKILPENTTCNLDSYANFILNNKNAVNTIHNKFISIVKNNLTNSLHIENRDYSINRFSINMIIFFGKDPILEYFNNLDILRDDEEFFSVVLPIIFSRRNGIYGDGIVSHYSFGPQKDFLDPNLLKQYKELQNLNLSVQEWKLKNKWEI